MCSHTRVVDEVKILDPPIRFLNISVAMSKRLRYPIRLLYYYTWRGGKAEGLPEIPAPMVIKYHSHVKCFASGSRHVAQKNPVNQDRPIAGNIYSIESPPFRKGPLTVLG